MQNTYLLRAGIWLLIIFGLIAGVWGVFAEEGEKLLLVGIFFLGSGSGLAAREDMKGIFMNQAKIISHLETIRFMIREK